VTLETDERTSVSNQGVYIPLVEETGWHEANDSIWILPLLSHGVYLN